MRAKSAESQVMPDMATCDTNICVEADLDPLADCEDFDCANPPANRERRLKLADPIEELTEVALSFLWCQLATDARLTHGGVTSLSEDAIRVGRELGRHVVRVEVIRAAANLATLKPLIVPHRAKWRAMGVEIGTAMSGAGRAAITGADIHGAFVNAYCAGNAKLCETVPAELTDPLDRATEWAGTHLWFNFAVGLVARAGARRGFEAELMVEGRAYSRRYVYGNLLKIANVLGHVDFTEWCWQEVGDCAYIAGRRAARLQPAGAISLATFGRAWCAVRNSMTAYRDRCYNNVSHNCNNPAAIELLMARASGSGACG